MHYYLKWVSLVILTAAILTGTTSHSAPLFDMAGPALFVSPHVAIPGPDRDDVLYIGIDDPYEVVTITGDFTHKNAIVIENYGRLEITGATVALQGDIIIGGEGALIVSNSSLTFSQLYRHEFGLVAAGLADIVIKDSIISGQGEIIRGVFAGEAGAHLQDSDFADGMTVSLMESASLSLSGMSGIIEAIISDEAALDAASSQMGMLMIWLSLPDGAAGAFSLPEEGYINSLDFPGDFPGVTGIGYSVSITDTEPVIFSLVSFSGSDVTISDSHILGIGLYFSAGRSYGLAGLRNFSEYNDFTLALDDRGLRLVRSDLWVWNIYAAGSAEVSIVESTVGEIFSFDQATAILHSSKCDGNGGYVSAQGDGTLVLFKSVIIPQIITSGSSATTISESELYEEIFVSEASTVAVINPVGSYLATPLDAGVLIEGAIDPPQGPSVGSEIEITGTSAIRAGPDSPVTYAGYELQYGKGSEPGSYSPIGSYHTEEVHLGALETWDTHNLTPGDYTLRLLIYFEEREEPAEVLREVSLGLPSEIETLIEVLALLGLLSCLMDGEEPPPAAHEGGGGDSGGCGCAFYRASAGSGLASSAIVYLLPVLFIGILKRRVRRKSL